jgi:hypothetical protein
MLEKCWKKQDFSGLGLKFGVIWLEIQLKKHDFVVLEGFCRVLSCWEHENTCFWNSRGWRPVFGQDFFLTLTV